MLHTYIIPTTEDVIKMIPTKQLKEIMVIVTMSLAGSLVVVLVVIEELLSMTVSLLPPIVSDNEPQLNSSADGIDKGHDGREITEKL